MWVDPKSHERECCSPCSPFWDANQLRPCSGEAFAAHGAARSRLQDYVHAKSYEVTTTGACCGPMV